MNDSFDHFIITRFNLKSPYTKIDVNNASWLEERMALFKKYCLPSVEAQTIKNFKWLIYFDINFPIGFRKEFEEIMTHCAFVKPVYLEEFSFENIRKTCNTHRIRKYLITSRLDSDDMIASNYVEKVQLLFNYQSDLLINFNSGLCYDTNKKILTKVKSYKANPFMSYIEKPDHTTETKTVFIDAHNKLKNYSPQHEINEGYWWLILVHGGNVINDIIGVPTLNKGYINSFPLFEIQFPFGRNYLNQLLKFYFKAFKKLAKGVLTKL